MTHSLFRPFALTFISDELPPLALCLQARRRRPLQVLVVLLLLLGRNVYRRRLQGLPTDMVRLYVRCISYYRVPYLHVEWGKLDRIFIVPLFL